MRWVVGSILHGGPSFTQCSTTGITKAVVCAVMWGDAYIQDSLLLTDESSPCNGGSGFPI